MRQKYKSIEPEWIFFGGTFDPPHVGHMEAVQYVRDHFTDAEIVLVPAFSPPVSKDQNKTVHASFADRVAMCVVAFDEWERVQVSSLEEDLEAPSYTIKTLRDLRAEYPTARLAWMIGADQLLGFANWLEPKAILETASLIVLPRPEVSKSDLVEVAAQLASSLGFKSSIDRDEGVVILDGGCPIYVLSETPKEISSTAIRSKMRDQGVVGLNGLVDESIANYIEDLGLYREEGTNV